MWNEFENYWFYSQNNAMPIINLIILRLINKMKEKPIQESIDSLCSSIKNPQTRDIVRSCLSILYQLIQSSDWAIPIHLQHKAKLKATGSISMSRHCYDDFWNSDHPQQNYENWEASMESFEKQVSIQFSELTSRVQSLESQIERQQALINRIQAADASFESSLSKSEKLREIEAAIEQLSRRLSRYAKENGLSCRGGSKQLSSGYVNASELQISSFLPVLRPQSNAVMKRSSLEPIVQNINSKC